MEDELAKAFGYWLRLQRKAHRMTQEDLADRVMMSRPTIVAYESGSIDVSLSMAANLASAVNSTLATFLDATHRPIVCPACGGSGRIYIQAQDTNK